MRAQKVQTADCLYPPPGSRSVRITPHLCLPGFVLRFGADEEIFGERDRADFVYQVISGAVRTTRLLEDARRQVGAFYFAGDLFGLENGQVHRLSAEAIGPLEVAVVRRAALDLALEHDVVAARELWTLATRALEDLQDHMMMMARKNAAERVGAFLLGLYRRGASPWIDLPMSRGDIADHLGLTLETVSRAFSKFSRDRIITMPTARRIVLRRPEALANI